MAPGGSKDLLALEHRSKEQHLERLLASRTKPNIERLRSTVLQDVQKFLPLMQKANESLDRQGTSAQADPLSQAGSMQGSAEDREDAPFELDENYEGRAIEMNLMLAPEDQIKMITDMEAVVRASQPITLGDSDDSSVTEDSEPDSSSDDDDQIDEAQMEISTSRSIVSTSDKTNGPLPIAQETADSELRNLATKVA